MLMFASSRPTGSLEKMAHTKAGGTTKLGRDSAPKYLGVKKYAGEKARPGDILIRQRGTHFVAGKNVKRGNDDTLFATANGQVLVQTKRKIRFDGTKHSVKVINIVP